MTRRKNAIFMVGMIPENAAKIQKNYVYVYILYI